MFANIKAHLTSNSGDENIAKMIWIAIAFVVGAILMALLVLAFKGPVSAWFENLINTWFGTNVGKLPTNADPITEWPGGADA